MYALQTNFNMEFSNVELNQECFEKVKLVFEDYPEVENTVPDLLILRNGSQFISLAPKKISFGKKSDLTQIGIDEVISVFDKIINVLEIHDSVKLSVSSDIISSPKEGSISNKSLKIQIPRPKDSIAIGLRYLIFNEVIFGEIRIEPYFKDTQKVFYSINLDSRSEMPFDSAEFIFKEFWSYIENIEGLSNELYES